MREPLAKQYQPSGIEASVYRRWLESGAFSAMPDGNPRRYVIMMPLPNVTGALHMGHAMDNVMQDLLIRWHRMMGENTLWQPGTDHAGIATQAIVEKRLFELEGKTRLDVGREALVERIWAWKDQYQKRIIKQQQSMGCSCDWNRQRFTMDPVCVRAVLWTFFRMFADGLIFRGTRLVNWDCHLKTAVADDEIVHETVDGHFWHLRYPVLEPRPGEPDHVTVATTRPETMLGDTAVACHPDPRAALEHRIEALRRRRAEAPEREHRDLEEELQRVESRLETHLHGLEVLSRMAQDGRQVLLPLLDRPIPLIADPWARPELGSGCVKITPGHDPNDYEVWLRNRDRIEIRNILRPDGTLNENAGPYQGLDRFDARTRVVGDLEKRGLVEAVEDRQVEIGHSDRSKTPIEPYLSLQWFVRTSDREDGVVCGRGTTNEFLATGLAQAAMDAAGEEWRSKTGRNIEFHPDRDRYRTTYLSWLAEKRDWCISRQLWWGHRIPIWGATGSPDELTPALQAILPHLEREDLCARLAEADGSSELLEPGTAEKALVGRSAGSGLSLLVCLREVEAHEAIGPILEGAGLEQDPDVLDTWFSSGVWPHSTLGWPDPATAQVDPGQPQLQAPGAPDSLSTYYPGSCLVTGRDIITLWVARMAMMGLYNLGDVPFTDVFIHANILDGKGERMSKSRGNGIDPVDIIKAYGADAMRYVLCEMQTGTQDIRLPVQAVSPYTGNLIDLATARHGTSIFTYLCPETGKEFDVLGTVEGLPAAKLVSDRFEVGRNFCNKLWNAARFALMNLEEVRFAPRSTEDLRDEDRWILSRLSHTIRAVHRQLEAYNPSAALTASREFFWSELCDWYLEMIKPRMRSESEAPLAGQVLATAVDQVLRLLHPFLPFLTEALWERLGEQAPERGIDEPLPSATLLVQATWPQARARWEDEALERRFRTLQEGVRTVREIRSRHNIAPARELTATVAGGEETGLLLGWAPQFRSLAGTMLLPAAGAPTGAGGSSATAVVGGAQIIVQDVVDPDKERVRLATARDKVAAQLDGSQRKLSNRQFVERANPQVVEKERQRATALQEELSSLEQALTALDSPA